MRKDSKPVKVDKTPSWISDENIDVLKKHEVLKLIYSLIVNAPEKKYPQEE